MDKILSAFDCNDIKVIKWQLNSENISMAGIVQKCIYGYPSVILLNPCDINPETPEKKPNYMAIANPLWLTCP
ncbi:MAG TPA: hypothetical protein PKZ93_09385, partial [Spirochaetota bacterium]|nr:hypothetical protein [Spirochaetota bacterium]